MSLMALAKSSWISDFWVSYWSRRSSRMSWSIVFFSRPPTEVLNRHICQRIIQLSQHVLNGCWSLFWSAIAKSSRILMVDGSPKTSGPVVVICISNPGAISTSVFQGYPGSCQRRRRGWCSRRLPGAGTVHLPIWCWQCRSFALSGRSRPPPVRPGFEH